MKEITLRSIFLSILITAALAGANAYLGLKAGMTVSASIPAAVISMGVLACFAGKKKGNNIDKLSGILPLIPRELKIKFM